MSAFASRIHSRSRRAVARAVPALFAALSVLSPAILAQTPALRCDLQLKSTPGAGAGAACLDLAALQAGGQALQVPGNATRISLDGLTLCKSAFTITVPGGADIVFIYDNSGSMVAEYARVDTATGDTAFFHGQGCGGGFTPTVGSLTYQTMAGPRTVDLVDASANCTGIAGDPYHARIHVIAQGIDFLARTSPASTAGAVAFAREAGHERPPLPLSVAGNAEAVKASLVMESITSTVYGPPLRQANAWLADTALTANSKRAIVFISDGAPSDTTGANTYLDAVGAIPIFSIFLGAGNSSFARLQDMSARTGGQFHRVEPGDIAQMHAVLQRIIQAITVTDEPERIEVVNNSFSPPMVSRSTALVRGADSSVSTTLDSIVALKPGLNDLTVRIALSPTETREYPLRVQADGPLAGASTETLRCREQPSLVLLNPQGQPDSAYPGRQVPYDVRLTRSDNDLAQVQVGAVSADDTRPAPWGDAETLVLTLVPGGGAPTYRREDLPLHGAMPAPTAGNGVLEATPGGSVTLTWVHPRDERERAVYTLPGTRLITVPGFVDMVRATDVSVGAVLPAPVAEPMVLRGGAVLGGASGIPSLVHQGALHNPHGLSDADLDPARVPTFLFKTAAPFAYDVAVYDNLGQFLVRRAGTVDSAQWDRMRGDSDSMAVALSILPMAGNGQPFATGVYILKATISAGSSTRLGNGTPARILPTKRVFHTNFGYRRR